MTDPEDIVLNLTRICGHLLREADKLDPAKTGSGRFGVPHSLLLDSAALIIRAKEQLAREAAVKGSEPFPKGSERQRSVFPTGPTGPITARSDQSANC